MPTYEYRCAKGHTFEVLQSIADDPVETCEVCGRPVVRVLHSPAVHFKGSGFYNTDYGTRKRQREQKATKAESASASSSGDGASSKSDSAGASPAAAPEKAAPVKDS